ncbi:MAG: hypothetical protein JNJ83_18965 [Verrucomicrobiaceae bacterium]|nr:hypothetical protein [Verrucomicrobiaceae bacterium]
MMSNKVPSWSLLLILFLASCQSTTVQRLAKARPAAVSPFLDQRWAMRPMRQRLPFHYVWATTDPRVQNAVASSTELYIAPVDLRYLRPIRKPLVKWEVRNGLIRTRETEMAAELRARIAQAFTRSPRFRLVTAPTKNSVTLALAITELTPTSVKGNAVKLAAKFTVGPLSGLLSVFTKGNIAIEGKFLVSVNGKSESYLQFSDNEKDKMTFYSVRDFQPYEHARVAMNEWGLQLEEFTRTMGNHQVKESSFVTLKPW